MNLIARLVKAVHQTTQFGSLVNAMPGRGAHKLYDVRTYIIKFAFYMGACILASCPLTSANHGSVAPIVTLIWRPYLAETRGAQCGAQSKCLAAPTISRKTLVGLAMSALGVPNSTSRPDPSTSTLSESRIVLSRCAIVSTVTEANSARTVRWRRDSDGQWNAKAIRVNRSQSEAIGGHQRPSGHQWPSVAISGHQLLHSPG